MGGKIVSYNQLTKYARELAESMNDLQLQEVISKTDETYWQVISLVNKMCIRDRNWKKRRLIWYMNLLLTV